MVKEIPLTQGYVALVDDDIYDEVSRYNWSACLKGRGIYGQRGVPTKNGRRTQYLHRLIWFLKTGERPKELDHINRNGLDNRIENLRLSNHSGNGSNRNLRQQPKTSQYKGVSWDYVNKKWVAQIHANSKQTKLGRFKSEDEAALAYDRAALDRFGDFAYTNANMRLESTFFGASKNGRP